MRLLPGFELAYTIMFAFAAEAPAQVVYVGLGSTNGQPVSSVPVPAPSYGTYAHAYSDEPVMSVNNSYLGYSNFVNPSQPTPRFITGRQPLETPAYVPVAERRGGRWFGWRRRARQ